ncbi:MAG: acyl carrier protein [Flexilinea sp.]
MTDNDKIQKLADLLEMGNTELTPETLLSDIESWDSLAKLSFIVLLDDEFHKTVTSDQIRNFVSVKDLLDFMN